MKLSLAILSTVAVAEKKVPPRHPLQRLQKLVQFSGELLDDWYGFLPSKDSWKGKFERNADRMSRNFERGNQKCGFYDAANEDGHGGRDRRAADDTFRYDQQDPAKGTQQITRGFSKWAQRYLSACSGQKNYNYQVNRMARWNNKLQAHLASQNNEGSGEN